MNLIKNNKGLTVIELMTVIAIIGILLAIAVPNYQITYDYYKLKTATDQILSDIKYTREQAISTGESWKIEFKPGNSYEIYQTVDDLSSLNYGKAVNPSQKTIRTFDYVTFKNINITGNSQDFIIFQNDGGVKAYGTVDLYESSSKRTKTISIDNAGKIN